jgi:hypothetical protein
MHHFPGVRWDEWPDMPYDVVMSCISLIDGSEGDGEV